MILYISAVCECTGDYMGADCATKPSDPPLLKVLDNSGLCNIKSATSCKVLAVYGERFIDDKLTCHITKAKVDLFFRFFKFSDS